MTLIITGWNFRKGQGDSYCSLSPARPFIEASTDLSEELPKKRRRTEVSVPIGSHGAHRQAQFQWCPSAGTISNVDVGSYRGCHRHPNCAYPCASGPGALAIGPINRSIEEERPCRV